MKKSYSSREYCSNGREVGGERRSEEKVREGFSGFKSHQANEKKFHFLYSKKTKQKAKSTVRHCINHKRQKSQENLQKLFQSIEQYKNVTNVSQSPHKNEQSLKKLVQNQIISINKNHFHLYINEKEKYSQFLHRLTQTDFSDPKQILNARKMIEKKGVNCKQRKEFTINRKEVQKIEKELNQKFDQQRVKMDTEIKYRIRREADFTWKGSNKLRLKRKLR